MMEFLYFPDDKTAYIIPVITLVLFFIGALIAMRFIIQSSKKELEKQEKQFADLQTTIENTGSGNHKER